MNQKEVQQSLKRILSRAQSGTERGKSGCGLIGRTVTEPQSSSALIGLLCRSSNPPRIPIPLPGSKVEAGAPNGSGLVAVQPSYVVGSKHSSSNESITDTRAPSTSAQAVMQECPLCQKLVRSGDLQGHINEELDNIMASAGDSQMMLCSTALGSHAVSRPSGRCQATAWRQAAPGAGPARQPLPHSSRESNVAQGSAFRGLACSGASSGRASIVTDQHGSEQADWGKGRKSGQYQSREARGTEDRGLKRPFGAAAPHDINHQRGCCAALSSSTSRAGKQIDQQEASRRRAEQPGADSGAGCRGPRKTVGRGRNQPQRPEDRRKAAAPSAKVLVLGGDQRDQQQNLQRRGKARGGRQVAGAASFDHYHTGHGFWDSGMLGLDGTESMGAHMWEGMGTATWSGLGPP